MPVNASRLDVRHLCVDAANKLENKQKREQIKLSFLLTENYYKSILFLVSC